MLRFIYTSVTRVGENVGTKRANRSHRRLRWRMCSYTKRSFTRVPGHSWMLWVRCNSSSSQLDAPSASLHCCCGFLLYWCKAGDQMFTRASGSVLTWASWSQPAWFLSARDSLSDQNQTQRENFSGIWFKIKVWKDTFRCREAIFISDSRNMKVGSVISLFIARVTHDDSLKGDKWLKNKQTVNVSIKQFRFSSAWRFERCCLKSSGFFVWGRRRHLKQPIIRKPEVRGHTSQSFNPI